MKWLRARARTIDTRHAVVNDIGKGHTRGPKSVFPMLSSLVSDRRILPTSTVRANVSSEWDAGIHAED
jgi:hypothetical protein